MHDITDKEIIAENTIDALVKIVAENKELFTFILWVLFFLMIALIIFIPSLFYKLTGTNNNIKINKKIQCTTVPCNGDIDLTFWLLYNFSKINKNKLKTGLLNACLLKWYKNGNIDIKKASALSNNDYIIDLKDGDWQKSISENHIYEFLKKVSGNSNTLEKNKLLNYCRIDKNLNKFNISFYSISREIERNLERYQQITILRPKFNLQSKKNKIILSDRLKMEYQNIFGFKRFILSSSSTEALLNTNTNTWDEYLIFASILGIDDKVKTIYKKLFPISNNDKSLFSLNFEKSILKYKANPVWTLLTILQTLITLFIVMSMINSEHSDILKPLIAISPFLIFASVLIVLLKNYYITKKVKEMNETTYATIIDVTSETYSERVRNFSDTGGYSNITKYNSYFCTYSYQVGNSIFRGTSECSKYAKKNKKIKIYYNKMQPDKSDTAYHHNFSLRIFRGLCIVFLIVGVLYLKFL